MKKTFLFFFSIIVITITNAQEVNVGLSGHLGMWKQYATINGSVTKNKWIIRPSLKYGNFGKNDSIYTGDVEVSGYSSIVNQELDKPYSNQYAYTSFWHSTVNKGISPELKLGRNFSKEESLSTFSIYISVAYYWINDNFNTYYKGYNLNNINETDIVTASTNVKHQNWSIGASLGYSYQISNKLNIEAMLNIPYYQPITSSSYNPNEFGVFSQNPKALMLNNINFDVSFGVNYQLK